MLHRKLHSVGRGSQGVGRDLLTDEGSSSLQRGVRASRSQVPQSCLRPKRRSLPAGKKHRGVPRARHAERRADKGIVNLIISRITACQGVVNDIISKTTDCLPIKVL